MQLAVGEDVAGQERVRRRRLGVQPRDAVVEEQPTGRQQVVQRARVGIELVAADVLVHADAGDLVERAVGDLAVVADADLELVGEAGGLDPLARQRAWASRGSRRHRGRRSVGGVDQQRAPAAADVQQPLAGGEAELAADQVELALLRVLE